MKILMTSCGGIVRGIEGWYEHGLAKELVKKGHEVTVYSSSSVSKYHNVKKEEIIEGIQVKRFNPVSPVSFLRMLKSDADIFHMHHLGYLAPLSGYAALRKRVKEIPAVFNVTGIYHDPYLVKDVNDPFGGKIESSVQTGFPVLKPWKILNWFVHLPMFEADRLIAMTKWEKNEVHKYGVPFDKIDVAPLGINTAPYKKTRKDFFRKAGIDGEILLFVGQPTQRKGWKYFLEAMPSVLKKFPNAKMVFVGYRGSKEMEDAVNELEIRNSVIMLGYLSDEDKIAAFQSADAFVLPTLYEGFGMVFLEALAAGLPIVTTNVAGNSEIVANGKNGLLVEAKNGEKLATAIIKMLMSKTLRKSISKNNIKKAKLYEWSNVVKYYIDSYEKAM